MPVFSMPHHLRYFEYASNITYAKVLDMQQYSYDNIIIVTNVIILQFLILQFVHPG